MTRNPLHFLAMVMYTLAGADSVGLLFRDAAMLIAVLSITLSLVGVASFRLYFRQLRRRQRTFSKSKRKIAFFHPYCAAAGGGERVLWKAVQALDELASQGLSIEVTIYTVDAPRRGYSEAVFEQVKSRFSIDHPKIQVEFVHLDQFSPFLDKADRFSLIFEAWGTMRFAYKALVADTPHVFFDTTGCAFTYFVAYLLAGCDVVAYVHYPTISTDMLRLVWDRRPTYNNDDAVARNTLVTVVKLIYYLLFAVLYGIAGSLCKIAMVNSTWTRNHITFLWRGASSRIHTVFPPCDVESLRDLPTERSSSIVVSIGQFRPEKDHALQIRSFARFRKQCPEQIKAQLVLIGSCRGAGDEARVVKLKQLVESMGIGGSVQFIVNQPYSEIKKWFLKGSVGLHSMWNEHFGIGVVEMMAAGLLVVAHNSGGPKSDIIVPIDGLQTGFLAFTEEEFADAIRDALAMSSKEATATRQRARSSSARFSDDIFNLSLKQVLLDSKFLR